MHHAPVRSDDLDLFAGHASKFYRHAEEPIFLVLIISSDRALSLFGPSSP